METKVSVSDKSIGFPRALRDMFSDAGFILPLVGGGRFLSGVRISSVRKLSIAVKKFFR